MRVVKGVPIRICPTSSSIKSFEKKIIKIPFSSEMLKKTVCALNWGFGLQKILQKFCTLNNFLSS